MTPEAQQRDDELRKAAVAFALDGLDGTVRGEDIVAEAQVIYSFLAGQEADAS